MIFSSQKFYLLIKNKQKSGLVEEPISTIIIVPICHVFCINCKDIKRKAADCRQPCLSNRSPSYYEVSQFLLVDLFCFCGVSVSSRGRSVVPLGP